MPRETAVSCYDRTSPCDCFADGMALATLAFLRPAHHRAGNVCEASSARAAYDAAMAAYGLFRVEPVEQRPACGRMTKPENAVAQRTMAPCRSREPSNPECTSTDGGAQHESGRSAELPVAGTDSL